MDCPQIRGAKPCPLSNLLSPGRLPGEPGVCERCCVSVRCPPEGRPEGVSGVTPPKHRHKQLCDVGGPALFTVSGEKRGCLWKTCTCHGLCVIPAGNPLACPGRGTGCVTTIYKGGTELGDRLEATRLSMAEVGLGPTSAICWSPPFPDYPIQRSPAAVWRRSFWPSGLQGRGRESTVPHALS